MNHKEMIEQLEQYKRQDGTYRIRRLIADENPGASSIDLTFALFFDMGWIEKSELVKLARKLNEQHGERQQAEIDQKDMALLAQLNRGDKLTNEELDFLVKHGNADNVYGDPDSNRPTGIVIRPTGKPHADWETEEELARLGL